MGAFFAAIPAPATIATATASLPSSLPQLTKTSCLQLGIFDTLIPRINRELKGIQRMLSWLRPDTGRPEADRRSEVAARRIMTNFGALPKSSSCSPKLQQPDLKSHFLPAGFDRNWRFLSFWVARVLATVRCDPATPDPAVEFSSFQALGFVDALRIKGDRIVHFRGLWLRTLRRPPVF